MTTFLAQLGHFRREVWLYLVTPALIGFTIFGGIYTVLLNLYLLRLGYGPQFVGLVNAAGFGTLAVLALPSGALGRRIGVRQAMILGMTLIAAGCGLLPLGEFVPDAWRPAWLLVMYSVVQFGMTLHVVNSQPFLMDVTTPVERDHVFSVQVALWPLAGFLGSLVGGLLPGVLAPLLGTTLEDPAPYRYTLLLAAALVLPGIIALLAIRDDASPRVQRSKGASTAAAPLALIALLALISFLRSGGEGIGRTFFNVYLDDGLGIATAQIGSLFAFAQLLAVPAALVAPALSLRWGKERLMIWGTIGLAASLLPMALIPDWRAAGLGLLGILLLTSISRGPFMIYIQEAVAPEWRPLISGATTMTFGVSWFSTAFSGGYIITHYGYRSLFLLGLALSLAGGILVWGYLMTVQRRRTNRVVITAGDD